MWGLAIVLLLAAGAAAVVMSMESARREEAARERKVVDFLLALTAAQEAARAGCAVDLDGDGRGEYLTWQELTGLAGPRTDAAGSVRVPPRPTPWLEPGTRELVEGGIVHDPAGWDLLYRVYLPSADGAVREGRPGSAFQGVVDTDRAETGWCAYAWPRGGGGFTYCVDATGAVVRSSNGDGRYSAADRVPEFDAAYLEGSAEGRWPGRLAAVNQGRDGGYWVPVVEGADARPEDRGEAGPR